ncbi:MAG: peptidoglycan-binding protein [Ilumatobacteraceae bacterium]
MLLTAGLTVSGTAVVSAGSATAAPASAPQRSDVIGLKKGDSGEAVRALQEALVRVGVGVKYGVDSYFGSATQASVKAFQRYKGLAITGVVDQATAAALGLVSPAPAAAAPASSSGVLARGSTGAGVTQLQQGLIAAGISVAGGADGIFGAATEQAVKTFQRAKGIAATGTADAATVAALGSSGAAPAAPPAVAPGTASAVVGLQLGSSGPAVVSLQQALISMGWPLTKGADGVFGANTRSAVLHLQRANSIQQTGTVTQATAKILGLTGAAPAAPAAPAPAVAAAASGATAAGFAIYDERGARVVALQQALLNAGIAVPGGADGAFGAGTAGAVMAFQRAKGLAVTGKVDANTAAALGLSAQNAPAAAAAVNIQLEAKPVQGPCYYGDSWAAARGAGRVHLGVDIVAAEGSQLYAVATGKVIQLYTDAPGSLSGNGVKIARPDGTYFFYAHLSALAPGIALGTQVTAGQLIGYVGHTGNAAGPHLHLEVHPGGGSAVTPYSIVTATGAC